VVVEKDDLFFEVVLQFYIVKVENKLQKWFNTGCWFLLLVLKVDDAGIGICLGL
jgi:hypothetical protein